MPTTPRLTRFADRLQAQASATNRGYLRPETTAFKTKPLDIPRPSSIANRLVSTSTFFVTKIQKAAITSSTVRHVSNSKRVTKVTRILYVVTITEDILAAQEMLGVGKVSPRECLQGNSPDEVHHSWRNRKRISPYVGCYNARPYYFGINVGGSSE